MKALEHSGSRAGSETASGATGEIGLLRADIRALLDRTEQMQSDLTRRGSVADAPLAVDPGLVRPWVLLGAGLFVGLLVGAAYGRRQERARRTRIRI
jgi:hypothetical protein